MPDAWLETLPALSLKSQQSLSVSCFSISSHELLPCVASVLLDGFKFVWQCWPHPPALTSALARTGETAQVGRSRDHRERFRSFRVLAWFVVLVMLRVLVYGLALLEILKPRTGTLSAGSRCNETRTRQSSQVSSLSRQRTGYSGSLWMHYIHASPPSIETSVRCT